MHNGRGSYSPIPAPLISFILPNQVSETISYALFAAAVRFGFGKHGIYASSASYRKIFQCLFGVILTGLWSSTFSRVSIAVLLLDFAPSRAWKIALWLLIVLQFIDLLGTEFIELFQCRPIRAFWDQVPGGKCNAPDMMQILIYVYNGLYLLHPHYRLFNLTSETESDRHAR